MDAYDTFLVLTFAGETRVLGMNDGELHSSRRVLGCRLAAFNSPSYSLSLPCVCLAEDELDEAEIPGFNSSALVGGGPRT